MGEPTIKADGESTSTAAPTPTAAVAGAATEANGSACTAALAEHVAPPAPVSVNRGRFKPGDARINRAGRPKGKKAAATADPHDIAPATDRLARVFVPWKRLGLAWLASLPADAQLVGARADLARGGVCLMLRSKDFARVARGTAVPEMEGQPALVAQAMVDGRRVLVARTAGPLGWLDFGGGTEVVDCLPDETGKAVIVVRPEHMGWVAAGRPLRRIRVGLHWG
jgi:hypothetical protein